MGLRAGLQPSMQHFQSSASFTWELQSQRGAWQNPLWLQAQLKGFASPSISETLLAPPLAEDLGGGLLQPSDHETSFGCYPSPATMGTCCQGVIPGDFISILQLALLGFPDPSQGAAQAACGRGAPRVSCIPQQRARTGSSKRRQCRRNPPTGISGEGDRPVETHQQSHWDAAPSASMAVEEELGTVVGP